MTKGQNISHGIRLRNQWEQRGIDMSFAMITDAALANPIATKFGKVYFIYNGEYYSVWKQLFHSVVRVFWDGDISAIERCKKLQYKPQVANRRIYLLSNVDNKHDHHIL